MGCLEVKCPFSIDGTSVVNMTPTQIAQTFPSVFLHTSDDRSLKLKPTHSYYAQVQGEMAIVGTEWCDFVVYTLAGIHVERIIFDTHFWDDKLQPSLQSFFRCHVLPKLDIAIPVKGVAGENKVTEVYLEHDQCQSRIGNRNGSNACTIISALMAKGALQGDA